MSRAFPSLLAALLALLPSPGRALQVVEAGSFNLDAGADVKGFFLSFFPYEHPVLFPAGDPEGLGVLDLRLKLEGGAFGFLSFGFAERLESRSPTSLLAAAVNPTGGSARGIPEAVDLSFNAGGDAGPATPPCGGAGHQLCGRVDRLFLKAQLPHVDLTAGRQPVTFGTTFFFTPTDLVAPFSPTTIDREYKPGVDAVRADAYFGESGTLTAVAAYGGSWDLPGAILVTRGGLTAGVWDLGLFVGSVHEDLVVGADTAGSLGATALKGEVTATSPRGGGSAFLRAAVGADRSFESSLKLSAELYLQSNGATDSAGMLAFSRDERVSRGELWALGRTYAALSAGYELHPLLQLGAFTVVNLRDPSALLGPSLAWSVAENAEVELGGYFGLGARPPPGFPLETTELGSEFGITPATLFLAIKAYL